jgi:biopolymer transport protein ExbB
MTKLAKLSAVVFFALVASQTALAADGESKSLFAILKDGMEWPGYLIIAGSIFCIALISEHFINVRRGSIVPADQVKRAKEMIENRAFRECLDSLKQSKTFFAMIMTSALQHARHGFDAMHEAAIEKSGELSGKMFRKVEYMNILGNLGPLMGLLGTVLGMIHAFGAMGSGGGQANAGDLARGISLALVNTLLGLSLAVIGLGFFGVCRNRIDSLTVEATVDSLDLLEYFRPSPSRSSESRRSSSSASSSSSAKPRSSAEPAAKPS